VTRCCIPVADAQQVLNTTGEKTLAAVGIWTGNIVDLINSSQMAAV
jgi:hypothetical protein